MKNQHLTLKDFERRQIVKSYHSDPIFKSKGPWKKGKKQEVENVLAYTDSGKRIHNKPAAEHTHFSADDHYDANTELRKEAKEHIHNEEKYKKLIAHADDHYEQHKLKSKSKIEKSNEITPLEAFDMLVSGNIIDTIEKSKGPWKKGKKRISVYTNAGKASVHIAKMIGLKQEVVWNFMAKNNIDYDKMAKDVGTKLKQLDVVNAITGKEDNEYTKDIVNKYKLKSK